MSDTRPLQGSPAMSLGQAQSPHHPLFPHLGSERKAVGVEPLSGALPGSKCPLSCPQPPPFPWIASLCWSCPSPMPGSLLPLLPQRGSAIGRHGPGGVLGQAVGVSLRRIPAGSWAVGVPQLGLLSQEAQRGLPASPGHPCVSHVSSTQRPVAPMKGPHSQAKPPAERLVDALSHQLPGHQADPRDCPISCLLCALLWRGLPERQGGGIL